MPIRYYKKHQRDGLYNYYKVLSERQPPAYVRVIFLNAQPIIDLTEYDLSSPGPAIDYKAIQENDEPITPDEHEAAHKQATSDEFRLYINGKPQ